MYRKTKISAAVGTALLLTALTGCAGPAFDGDVTDCTVSEKTAAATKSGTDYRIYTDCGVFQTVDDWPHGQFNSADTYNSIEVGKTYDFEAYGYRNGFFSMFPNILKATEVPS